MVVVDLDVIVVGIDDFYYFICEDFVYGDVGLLEGVVEMVVVFWVEGEYVVEERLQYLFVEVMVELSVYIEWDKCWDVIEIFQKCCGYFVLFVVFNFYF